MKFRKKPLVVEAEQFHKGKIPYPEGVYIGGSYCTTQEAGEWCELHKAYHLYPIYKIKTLEGEHIVSHLDWIITGIRGELYPCKPDIFEQTYEPVKEDNIMAGDKKRQEELESGIYEILKTLCIKSYSRSKGKFWKSYESLSKEKLGEILALKRLLGQ